MIRPCFRLAQIAIVFAFSVASAQAASGVQADVVVYGGTPSGVMAAVAAARHGHTVILIDVNNHLGGAASGGLCHSDIGDPNTVGGLAAEFFSRVNSYYVTSYGAKSSQVSLCNRGYDFEPHVAELIFHQMIDEQAGRITVYEHCRFKSATVVNGLVTSLTVNSLNDNTVRTYTGSMFIDASYEGDLMAGAHIPYTVGRESVDQYGETTAGISDGPQQGDADGKVMAYNYRLSLTAIVSNRVLFPKPVNYDPAPWKALFYNRIKSGAIPDLGRLFFSSLTSPTTQGGPNHKYDGNSSDDVGLSYGYPDGSWATRDKIASTQRDYVLSELYYLQNDSGLPAAWLASAQQWGFPADEFTDNQGFPFQLYVREGRRMVGNYVLHLYDLTQDRYKPDGICDGSYGTDCHIVQHLTINGKNVNDATEHINVNNYDIPYSCIFPKKHPGNVLVTVCLSASHVAYCSVRMEPVYMMLGHAAGDAASLALEKNTIVQNVDVHQLRGYLLNEKAVLDRGYAPHINLTVTPTNPTVGQAVHLHANFGGLLSPITQMSWDLDGTGNVGATGADAYITYQTAKIYHVSFVALDQAGRRRMVFADVPVGPAAVDLDATVDDLEALKTGHWENATFPSLGGATYYSDVFINASVAYSPMATGNVATAVFQPDLLQAGHYQICLGYRPAAKQASNLSVSISNGGQVVTQTVNELTKVSPFPFVSLGTFYCNAGVDSSVTVSAANANGTVMVDAVRWVWTGP